VREAADDQQMLVGLVLSRIEENQGRIDNVATLTAHCVHDAESMVTAAHSLNETTGKFVL
jgi:hypothetical protein